MTGLPERIVHVDDDMTVRTLVRESLDRAEGEVILVACSNGQELISRLRELQPDLILLDLVMPEMSGPDTVAALRDDPDGKDVPVIFMTGRSQVEMTEDYKHLGVIGVIHKPFSPNELPDQIGALWSEHAGPPANDDSGDGAPAEEGAPDDEPSEEAAAEEPPKDEAGG